MEIDNPSENITQDEVAVIELPAPPGWKKKFTPKKGGTPKRNEIVFISPTGEEIKTRKQLELYLKSHSGGLSTSDFDWGTGETPRRSARLNEKTKATESPESETPKKRQKKSIPKKGAKGKNDGDDEGQGADEDEDGTDEDEGAADEDEGAADENKGTAEETRIGAEVPPISDAEDATEHDGGLVITDKVLPDKDHTMEVEQKINEEMIAAEELGADESMDVKMETSATEKTNENQVENQEASRKSTDVNKEAENKSLPSIGPGYQKEAGLTEPGPYEAVSVGQISDAWEDSASKLGDAEPLEPVTSEVGDVDQPSEKPSVEKGDGDSSKKDEAEKTVENQLRKEEANAGKQDVL